MNVLRFKKYLFKSWKDDRDDKRWAIACVEEGSTWFNVAVNACRDGDMGGLREDGTYDRLWATDDICNSRDGLETMRPATRSEVLVYLKRTGSQGWGDFEGKSQVLLIDSIEPYILVMENDKSTLSRLLETI